MHIILLLLSLALILVILFDAFQTVVLPRRVGNRLRITAIFYRTAWTLWSAPARRLPPGPRRENYLAFFGPLSLLMLLSIWVVGLVLAFAILLWALHSPVLAPEKFPTFWTDLYDSGSTFFTLGLGDVTPRTGLARFVMVTEVGTGLAFLALAVGYLPTLYQAFAQRETNISMLDARAGSPPTAVELLLRCGGENQCQMTREFLADWERWTAELLETHLSYPVLGYYRSQHENQSWLASLATILDVAALAMLGIDGVPTRQGYLTFAMARHTIVDLAQVYGTPPKTSDNERISKDDYEQTRQLLTETQIFLRPDGDAYDRLAELRGLYEPYVDALSEFFLMPIPAWKPDPAAHDNWESTAWNAGGRMRL